MVSSKKYLVLLSLISLAEMFAVLVFPNRFYAVFAISCVLAILSFLCFFTKKQFGPAILFSFIILLSAVNPYKAYVNKELDAGRLILRYSDREVSCSAKITDSHHYSSYSVLFANLNSVDGEKLSKTYPVRISSYTAASIADGDIIEFTGKLIPLSLIEEDEFDTSTYLKGKNVFIDIPSAVIVSSKPPERVSLLMQLRNYTKNIIYKYTRNSYDYNSASVSYAMFAGDKDYISDDIKEAFAASGTTHVLCVSGMHLTIITGVIFSLLSLFTVHKRFKCIFVSVLCLVYALFTGFSLSTVRACIMCIISFFALLTGRKTDGFLSLFFAVLAICTFSPYSIFDISLMLSFSSCLGILVFSEIFTPYRGKNKLLKALSVFLSALLTNLGAVFFTLPFSAYFFGGMSHFSAVTTLIISFECELLLTALLIMMILSPLSVTGFFDGLLFSIGTVCKGLCSFIIGTCDFFSKKRYSFAHLDKDSSAVFFLLFLTILAVLTVSIALNFKRSIFLCVITVMCLGTVFSFLSLYSQIINFGTYNISYFRQNKDDRQLSIRLMNHGYLIVNADSNICTDKRKAEFDTLYGNNYLLLIPDESINSAILSQSIDIFDSQYGIKKIFVPRSQDGAKLISELEEYSVRCFFMPENSDFGNMQIEFSDNGFYRISVKDSKTHSCLVMAKQYSKDYFDKDSDICAFFTRETKNQFNPDYDIPPDCNIFFTRMGRDDTLYRTENTFNKKSFMIKE